MSLYISLKEDIKKVSDTQKAKFFQRFFKTKKGEYGYGDIFAGLTVPQSRVIAKKYKELSLRDIDQLLNSKVHEERLIALFILIDQFKKTNNKKRKEIFDFYLTHTKYINNWDLVDLSADKIVGTYLFAVYSQGIDAIVTESIILQEHLHDRILTELAQSSNIWERRISIIATFTFIKSGYFKETLKIAEILLYDKEDLIHKAVGWMLREVGKRVSIEEEEMFLRKHYKSMPRTMLRYAIEKFPEEKRKAYLKGMI